MEIEVLLDLIELILTQKDEVEDFAETIIKRNFVIDEETLLAATQLRQIVLVRFILEHGVKPTFKTFQYTAKHEFFELCHLFVEFGSRKILSTSLLEGQLKDNLLDNNLENVKNLINSGVDFIANNVFLIRLTSSRGDTEVFRLLLEHGIDHTIDNNCAIKLAVQFGNFEIVRLLLEKGEEHRIKNEVIQLASRVGYIRIVQLLLDYGADPTANKNEAIQWASVGGHLEVVRLLLNNNTKYKVDPTTGNNYAIKWASKYGYFEIIELLKQYGASF
jgi:ankyrin repeat protein